MAKHRDERRSAPQPVDEARFDRRHDDDPASRHHENRHGVDGRRVAHLLDHILTRVCSLEEQGKVLIMGKTEQLASLKRIEKANANIAADIRRLKDRVVSGMSDADVAEVQLEMDKQADALEGTSNDPDNPDPDAPPEGTPV
jgi:hypothetical protein